MSQGSSLSYRNKDYCVNISKETIFYVGQAMGTQVPWPDVSLNTQGSHITRSQAQNTTYPDVFYVHNRTFSLGLLVYFQPFLTLRQCQNNMRRET
jgi:hypothetical protein